MYLSLFVMLINALFVPEALGFSSSSWVYLIRNKSSAKQLLTFASGKLWIHIKLYILYLNPVATLNWHQLGFLIWGFDEREKKENFFFGNDSSLIIVLDFFWQSFFWLIYTVADSIILTSYSINRPQSWMRHKWWFSIHLFFECFLKT